MMVETGVVRVGISAPTYLLALDLYCPGILCTLHYTIGITNGEQVRYISVTQNVRTQVPTQY